MIVFFKNFLAGECENDAECTTSQACFNFKCKDSCQDACGIGAQCKPVNHGKSNSIWNYNNTKQIKKKKKRKPLHSSLDLLEITLNLLESDW